MTTAETTIMPSPSPDTPVRLGLGLVLAALAHDDELRRAICRVLDDERVYTCADHPLLRLVLVALTYFPRGQG